MTTRWDSIGEHLIFIERGAEMAARHVGHLFKRPDWKTLAEDELERTEKVLQNALIRIQAARELYRRKKTVA